MIDSPDSNFFILRKHRLFQKLTRKECRELMIEEGYLTPKKNEFIYFNKHQHDRVYFLKKGYVKVGHYDESGQEVITEIIKEGDIFGQIGLEMEKDQGEFAQAIKEDASICSFRIQEFEKILEKKPDLAISFTRLIGLKFKRMQNRLRNIVFKDVKHRLIDFFVSLGDSHNLEMKDKIIIPNYLTHADVASLIGSTRQTVTSLISQLEQERLLVFDRKEIVILSQSQLRKKLD